jgi:hypothetical protein
MGAWASRDFSELGSEVSSALACAGGGNTQERSDYASWAFQAVQEPDGYLSGESDKPTLMSRASTASSESNPPGSGARTAGRLSKARENHLLATIKSIDEIETGRPGPRGFVGREKPLDYVSRAEGEAQQAFNTPVKFKFAEQQSFTAKRRLQAASAASAPLARKGSLLDQARRDVAAGEKQKTLGSTRSLRP